ncbi:MAG: hypothetical protein J7M38_03305 [Armatimonadetes bacterium]|nr:hypothetical protein [Armatimonadota bacterium]
MSQVDWSRHKVICFESDDWGCCCWAPTPAALQRISAIPQVREDFARRRLWQWVDGSLETPEDVIALCDFLESFTGADGRPVVFTPCYIVANPDYEAMAEDGMSRYHDITIDRGVPSAWERGDFVAPAREGIRRGVWRPEYHARLHHTQPYLWLETVRDGHPEAAPLFEEQIFQQSAMRPEYEQMDEPTRREWIEGGMRAFERAFGYLPECAINCDADDVTEGIWWQWGVRTRLNRQPQEGAAGPSPHTEMTWLRRNAHLEPLGVDDEYAARGFTGCWREIQQAWAAGEPAIVSTHRKNYVSFVDEQQRQGYMQLEMLLVEVADTYPETVFLTSAEIGQLHRRGVSALVWPDEIVCRNYAGRQRRIPLPVPPGRGVSEATDLRTGERVDIASDDEGRPVLDVPEGDFSVGLTDG